MKNRHKLGNWLLDQGAQADGDVSRRPDQRQAANDAQGLLHFLRKCKIGQSEGNARHGAAAGTNALFPGPNDGFDQRRHPRSVAHHGSRQLQAGVTQIRLKRCYKNQKI